MSSELRSNEASARCGPVTKMLEKSHEAGLLEDGLPPSQLCSDCSRITLAALSRREGCQTLAEGLDLSKTAQVCGLCAVVYDIICPVNIGDVHAEPNDVELRRSLRGYRSVADYQGVRINLQFAKGLRGDVRVAKPSIEVYLARRPGYLIAYIGDLRLYTPDVDSALRRVGFGRYRTIEGHGPMGVSQAEKTMEAVEDVLGRHVATFLDLRVLGVLAEGWIEECILNHPDCCSDSRDYSSSTLPTRVLDL